MYHSKSAPSHMLERICVEAGTRACAGDGSVLDEVEGGNVQPGSGQVSGVECGCEVNN